jgi:hypothetical protein
MQASQPVLFAAGKRTTSYLRIIRLYYCTNLAQRRSGRVGNLSPLLPRYSHDFIASKHSK